MCDFGTILKPDNTTLDLYCNSITTTAPNQNGAYAILSSTTTSGTTPVGVPTLINWATSQSQAYKNIVISGGDTLFTLGKVGNYLVELNISLELPADVGAQHGVGMLVNGTPLTVDVGFGNGVSFYIYKGTLKAFVSKPSDDPVVISFQTTALIASSNQRYAQLSIVKLE